MIMHDYIVERAKGVGKYILENNATVRQTGKEFRMSKSTVHKDIHRLEKINPALYSKVIKLMDEHAAVRHIHGGEATRRRWLRQKAVEA